jgi:hypothetical protein
MWPNLEFLSDIPVDAGGHGGSGEDASHVNVLAKSRSWVL